MRKIISLVFILCFVLCVQFAQSQSGDGPIWVSGEVSSIFEDKDGAIFSLTLANGENYNISATAEMIETIKVGDQITVEVNRGWAVLIEKTDAKSDATPIPETKKTSPQWVAGTLEAITAGPEDSLLSIKLSNDKVFNVSASNDILSGINVGDYITVKIIKGWAQNITKK
jgi:acetamidase/formamidase